MIRRHRWQHAAIRLRVCLQQTQFVFSVEMKLLMKSQCGRKIPILRHFQFRLLATRLNLFSAPWKKILICNCTRIETEEKNFSFCDGKKKFAEHKKKTQRFDSRNKVIHIPSERFLFFFFFFAINAMKVSFGVTFSLNKLPIQKKFLSVAPTCQPLDYEGLGRTFFRDSQVSQQSFGVALIALNEKRFLIKTRH